MRGLTTEERDMLARCSTPYEWEEGGGEPDPSTAALLDRLIHDGRVALVKSGPGWIYQATTSGRLALSCALVKA